MHYVKASSNMIFTTTTRPQSRHSDVVEPLYCIPSRLYTTLSSSETAQIDKTQPVYVGMGPNLEQRFPRPMF